MKTYQELAIETLHTDMSISNLVRTKIALAEDNEDAFFVADLADVVKKHQKWTSLLPQVEPHYAVKCNDDPAVLQVLANLGTGFDCASKAEINKVLQMGVNPSRIIYANPCKQTSHIKFAAKHGIKMMTFDNSIELDKVKAVHPDAELVLRLLPPDAKAQCQLGMKYGCHLRDVKQLLEKAKELELKVIGISFHVGSGCYDAKAFSVAVADARTAFNIGKTVGYKMNFLDIGGGFPGQENPNISFEEICVELNKSLGEHFPASTGVRIISEPGRYFVASAYHLAVNVIAKRAVSRDKPIAVDDEDQVDPEPLTADDEPSYMYYVNDGVYGSFNCLLYDHASVTPTLLKDQGSEKFSSSVWGPTCDGLDCILEQTMLPQLEVGDYILFQDMGAYTMCAASNFNGMASPKVHHTFLRESRSCMFPSSAEKNFGEYSTLESTISSITSLGLPILL